LFAIDPESGGKARPLRIAMVTTFYPPFNFGGDGIYVRRIARALARRGCEVTVIHDVDAWRVMSGEAPAPEPEPEPPGVSVHRLESRWPLGATFLTQQTGRPVVHGAELRRLLSADFDVINYHNVSLVGGTEVLTYGDALKLYTAHEHWLVCPTHVLWRHNKEACTGRECIKCTIVQRRPPQIWRLTGDLERACESVDVFIAMTRSTANNHKAFGFKREMALLPSFMADEESTSSPELKAALRGGPASARERPFFLFVGRLENIKGLQDVIPVFDEAMPADLLIAGSGNYEPQLRELAKGRENVKFLGQLPPQTLPALYSQALALLTPSLCYEVFPMVMLEAFRQGTPVIARDFGPYPEIVEESGAGLLFSDPVELRAALMRFLQEPRLRERLGRSGLAAVRTRWSEATAVDNYLDLIQATAETRGRPLLAAKVRAMPRMRTLRPEAPVARVARRRPSDGAPSADVQLKR
jgi:glycosyltransferase involved in cell wall biosynthesis